MKIERQEVPCVDCPNGTYYGCSQGFTCARLIVWQAVVNKDREMNS